MVSKNEHTGEKQQTKVPSQQYKDNYDLIFRKKKTDAEKIMEAEFLDHFFDVRTDR